MLVYSVDPRQRKSVDMDKLIAAVGRRINPSGVKELTIRQYGAEQLEVIIPEIEEREVEQIKKRISTSGLLEFRIVANEIDDKRHDHGGRRRRPAATSTSAASWWAAGCKPARTWKSANDDACANTEGRGREILVRIDPYDVDGRVSRAARAPASARRAWPSTSRSMPIGAEKFGQLTSQQPARYPAIRLPSPLGHRARQRDALGAARSTARFTTTADHRALHPDRTSTFWSACSTPAACPPRLRPEPISQQRISSQLGDDTIRKGTMAIVHFDRRRF